ncbi:MAG: response regulator, partial [Desulfobacterales bacterium]|nr:response regulator [Desulfobacterales bacterium]
KKINILLIEDHQYEAEILIQNFILSNILDINTKWVNCLSDGIDLLKNKSFDLIILDLNLPDSSGLETFNTIHRCYPDIPIIIYSSDDDINTATQAIQKGAQDYLIKQRWDKGYYVSRAIRMSIERDQNLKRLKNTQEALNESNKLNRQLNEFTFIISHVLREPIRGIYNLTDFFVNEYGNILNKEQKSIFDIVLRQCKRQEDQIVALLKYSRIGRMELKIEKTDLDIIIKDMIPILKSSMKNEIIDFQIPRPLPTIYCDKSLVSEIYQNLITNAVKYNDKVKKIVEIGFNELVDNSKIFYIKDNGIGIEKNNYEKIFGMFYRPHDQNEYGGGLGVGLSIAQKIIEQHGGKIWLDSKPNEGTVFYFTI